MRIDDWIKEVDSVAYQPPEAVRKLAEAYGLLPVNDDHAVEQSKQPRHTDTPSLRVYAYVGGGLLAAGSAVGFAWLLGGPVAGLTAAGAIGGVLLWLSKDRASDPPKRPRGSERMSFQTDLPREEIIRRFANVPPAGRSAEDEIAGE